MNESRQCKIRSFKIEWSSSGIPDDETSDVALQAFRAQVIKDKTIGSCNITNDRYRRNV